MALNTYAAMQTAIANELHRSDLATPIIDFITLAESKINKSLRVREMETTMATVMASGVIAVPTNYIALKDAYISSTKPYGRLERRTAEWIYDKYPDRTATRQPVAIAREGSNFIFGAFPDSNYTVTLVYYNRLISLATATNTVFNNYPGIWLYGACAEAAPYLKDDNRIQIWEAKFKQLLDMAQDESDDEYYSGGVIQVQAG